MEHVVFYPGPDNAPAFRRLSSLADALSFVEHLRNVEEVHSFGVFALTEVPLSFTTVFRAQVPGEPVATAGDRSEWVPAPSLAVPFLTAPSLIGSALPDIAGLDEPAAPTAGQATVALLAPSSSRDATDQTVSTAPSLADEATDQAVSAAVSLADEATSARRAGTSLGFFTS